MVDDEVALFHYASDRMADGTSDLSKELTSLIGDLANLLEECTSLNEEDAVDFNLLTRKAFPELRKMLSQDVGLESLDCERVSIRQSRVEKSEGSLP